MECCIICKSTEGNLNVVFDKGYKTLLEICKMRDEKDMSEELKERKKSKEKILVHHDCRRKFTNIRNLEKEPMTRKKLIN